MLLPLAFFFGGAPSSPELMLVFLAILLLFGAKRLPEIARGLGKSLEQFKRAAKDVTDEIMKEEATPPKARGSLPPSKAFPSKASTRLESLQDEEAGLENADDVEVSEEDSPLGEISPDQEAGLEDVGDDEVAKKDSLSETSLDEESADAGTS